MGFLNVTAKALFESFGLEVVVPPPCTKKTLSLGTKHAPEFACLPLKINIGNYIEAIEMGADTIIMGGGVGPCRF
jgi:predicted nucleotide-binding protein (sugar kinase/HSP70/actin superfamily)